MTRTVCEVKGGGCVVRHAVTAGSPPASLVAALRQAAADAERRGGDLAIALRHLQRGDRWDLAADEPFTAASTIKVPILVALYDAAAAGRLDLDRPLRLRAEDQVTGSGVLQLLSPGARLRLRDLAELMIAVSDNGATNIILKQVGIERVNALMARLGLRATRVLRPLQVIPAGASGTNTVSAGDLADLLALIACGQAVSWEACRRMVATLKRQQANDALPAHMPDREDWTGQHLGALPAWEWAHKTGGIPGHAHDCGLLYLAGQTVAVAVLTRGCGTQREAKTLIARVGRAVWEGYATGPADGTGA